MSDIAWRVNNGGLMRRFGGQPYREGGNFRCPDDNGIVLDGVCTCCGAIPVVSEFQGGAC